MNPRVVPINTVLDQRNFSRKWCLKCLKNKNAKCIKFYDKFFGQTYNNIEVFTCPYGYKSILFADQIIPSIIDKSCNIKKIKRRDRYNGKHKDIKEVENDYEIYTYNLNVQYQGYLDLYNEYEKIKPLAHDISNSISSFLDFQWKKEYKNIGVEILNGYGDINDLLSQIKQIKSKHLSHFAYDFNYNEVNLNLCEKTTKFYQKIRHYYDISENYKGLSDEEQTLISGFGLYKTLIDYYDRVRKRGNLTTTTHNHKPHKMLKKLAIMLNYKAIKREITVEFTQSSHKTENIINNISDLYIAFFSIIENAIKYSKPKSVVTIDIQDKGNNVVIVCIDNTSEYIDVNEIDSLKELGYKGSNSFEKSESSGYGLYLAHQIFSEAKIEYKYEYKNGKFRYKVHLRDYI